MIASLAVLAIVLAAGSLTFVVLTRRRNLRGSTLTGVDLVLLRATRSLVGADLRAARLSGQDLRETPMDHANLREADLTGADLREASLCGADLSTARLDRSLLHGARYDAATRWPPGVDPVLRGARPVQP